MTLLELHMIVSIAKQEEFIVNSYKMKHWKKSKTNQRVKGKKI